MGLQGESWVNNILRTILAGLDYVVYGTVKNILFLTFDLANLTTSSKLLNDIYSRIYVLLGVFMAFKLSFSFFQYIVDPESMTGKSEKGVGKLISRTIVMLIALVGLPTILFGSGDGQGLVQRAQNAFLPMLPRVIFGISEDSGVSVSNGDNTEDISNAANTMAAYALGAFFAPSPDLDTVCPGKYANTPRITSLEQFVSNVNLSCWSLGRGDSWKYYQYSYLCVLSTVVGLLLVIILIGIAIDVGKRVFKMIILQAIAPIPIMSLIDPKSSKDGAFSHWLKSLISTFLEIFFKLGLVYLVLMFMQYVINGELFSNYPSFSGPNGAVRSSFLTLALILALFLFAKEAPKFIKDAMGIKDTGGGFGQGMGAAMGAIGGAIGGFIGGRGLAGMATGAMAGATADPKVGGYAAGRDIAGQLRTGDKNWKGGLANSFMRSARDHQGTREARKFGVTSASLSAAKDAMKKDEELVESLQQAYGEAVQSGDASAIATARTNLNAAIKQSRDSKKRYEGMDKIADTFGIKTPKHVEMKQKGSAVYKVRRAITEAPGKAGRAIGEKALKGVEKVPGLGAAVRTIDSVVQQHGINQVTRGATFRDSSALTQRRDDLDSKGTLQSKTGHIDGHGHITRRNSNNNNSGGSSGSSP